MFRIVGVIWHDKKIVVIPLLFKVVTMALCFTVYMGFNDAIYWMDVDNDIIFSFFF